MSMTQGGGREGFPTQGVSRFGLVRPGLCVLLHAAWDFSPILSGSLPICHFPLSWPIKRTFSEKNGKQFKPPSLGNPRLTFVEYEFGPRLT